MITLEQIQAEHTRLGALIAALQTVQFRPTADGPTREDGQTDPSPTTSDRGLPTLPAATAVGTCIKNGVPAVAYAYTSDQMLAFRAEGVVQERTKFEKILEEAFRNGYSARATYNDMVVSDFDEEWEKSKPSLLRAIRKG